MYYPQMYNLSTINIIHQTDKPILTYHYHLKSPPAPKVTLRVVYFTGFDKCTMTQIHHYTYTEHIFFNCSKNPLLCLFIPVSLQSRSDYCLHSVTLHRLPHKCSQYHTACGLFRMAYFTQKCAFKFPSSLFMA